MSFAARSVRSSGRAVRPDRDPLEIRFPRVEGYRVELPEERLTASFNNDSILELTPDIVARLLAEYDEVNLALLDRTESEIWRQRTEQNAQTVRMFEQAGRVELLYDEGAGTEQRLRIWRAHGPGAAAPNLM